MAKHILHRLHDWVTATTWNTGSECRLEDTSPELSVLLQRRFASATHLRLESPSGRKYSRFVECRETVTQVPHSMPKLITNSPSFAFKMLMSSSLG